MLANGNNLDDSEKTGAANNQLRERSDVADLERFLRGADPSGSDDSTEGGNLKRSQSWCDAQQRRRETPETTALSQQLRTPGGFRRGFLHERAEEAGIPFEARPQEWSDGMPNTRPSRSILESSYQSFHSAGNSMVSLYDRSFGGPRGEDDNISLFGSEIGAVHGLTRWGVAVAVFKGNLNANLLLMAGGFRGGGWLFGLGALSVLASISTLCIGRLLQCRTVCPDASYGDIMDRAAGRRGRNAVDLCVILLQSGVGCMYFINSALLLQQAFLPNVNVEVLIFAEAIIIAPLTLIRNLSKLGPLNMFAGFLVLFGAVSMVLMVSKHLVDCPAMMDEFHPVNWQGASVMMGMACYAMEGIGLVIPIYDSAAHKDDFLLVYAIVAAVIVAILSVVSSMGYLAFGIYTQSVLLLNLGPGIFVKVIQTAFAVDMLGTFPLQVLPAVRLIENLFFGPSRPQTCDKHRKNAFRAAFVLLISGVSMLGSSSLENFVSLVGAVCGLPLAFVFPAFAHDRLVQEPRRQAARDAACTRSPATSGEDITRATPFSSPTPQVSPLKSRYVNCVSAVCSIDGVLVGGGLSLAVYVGYGAIATWGVKS